MTFQATILDGKAVRLEPLAMSHKEGLQEAIYDGELWKLQVTSVPHPDNIDTFFNTAFEAYEKGDGLTFATISKETNLVVGSSRLMKSVPEHKRIEIGSTFIAQSWQRTRINTEAKLLMLSHAFETLALHRVELLTDYLNNTSRRAITRIGAKEEGVLRNHMIMPDGRIRDSVLHSIVKDEWPEIKKALSQKLL